MLRVREDPGIVQEVPTGERHGHACMLGGDNGRTLFICTAPGVGSEPVRLQQGRIEFTRVDVPHAGRSWACKLCEQALSVLNIVPVSQGGRGWESNPPGALSAPRRI